MSHDDPRITAFALNELPATEREEIERLIQTERTAADEIAQTQGVAGILRTALHAEPAEGLTSRHREAIFRAALGAGQSARASEIERKIILHPALWQRAGFWQAAAACMICAFGAYAITARLYGPAASGQGVITSNNPNEFSVQIGQLGKDVSDPANGNPEIVFPRNFSPAERQALVAKFDAARTQRIAPANPNPAEAVGRANPNIGALPAAGQPEVASAKSEEDPITELRRNASIGKKPASTNNGRGLLTTQLAASRPAEPVTLKADLGSVTLTGDEVVTYNSNSEYMQARWKEASSLHAGDSYATLARHFRRDGGITPGKSHRFVMIRCPLIKVDVEFKTGEPTEAGLAPGAVIEKISRPYLEPEAND